MKYKSCHSIEHGIIFTWEKVVNCCMYKANDGANILFDKYFSSKDFSIEKIFEKKRRLRENLKKGIIPQGCQNCYNLEEKDWDDDDYIKYVYVSHWTKCNCNCAYCYYDGSKKFFQKFKNDKLLPILKKLAENKQLRNDGYLIITGGEPSCLNELSSIINFAIKQDIKDIYLNSSCIKYEKSIEKALKKDKIEITLSLDSSNKELYKKIKRIDAFDKVIKNIKKYIKAQNEKKTAVRIKYIILPNINDSIEEMDNWLILCQNIGIKKVILDIETHWYLRNKNNIPEHIKELINHFKEKATDMGFEIDFYSHVSQINCDLNK